MNETKNDRQKISFRTNIIGICVNILLFGFKFSVGTLSHSISIVADSYNNLTDSLSNIISMIGSFLSNKPADKDHPYGHGRIEYIAAFIVAFLVLQVGLFSFINSVKKIFNPEALYVDKFVLTVLIVSIFAKLLLGAFYKNVSKKINSNIFLATANDSISDSIITLGTLVSLLIFLFLNINVDPYVGVIVSIIIIINGIRIVKETMEPLIGEHIDPTLFQDIQNFVKQYPEIIDTHDLIIHNYGPEKYMCSIHVEVDKTKDIEYLHEIIDTIERDIKEQKNLLLVIHLDPIDLNNEKTNEYRTIVKEVIDNIKTTNKLNSLSFHDLRCVFGKTNTNIIFDLVIPWDVKGQDYVNLIDTVKNQIQTKIKNVSVVINDEKSFCE